MKNYSLAAAERIMKQAGVERVSEEAKETLCSLMEEYAVSETKKALLMMKHAGRKTIKKIDFGVF